MLSHYYREQLEKPRRGLKAEVIANLLHPPVIVIPGIEATLHRMFSCEAQTPESELKALC